MCGSNSPSNFIITKSTSTLLPLVNCGTSFLRLYFRLPMN
ncbi:hypothetical protein E2C01_069285 [Portunus trituberculatus]|uniref:Uncharacterized protein n=1 Tax=Portunus trituberculatus TaxID=210409 RepID=A0A5B7HYH5_PORTR|nr:hypothetical protein [Portunus trituberculatus]